MDCTWNSPGADPYRGPVTATVAAAVARYDLPAPVRADLVAKVRNGLADGAVRIHRDRIDAGPWAAASDLRDMHHGRPGRMCPGPVSRAGWAPDHVEPALVYCSANTCIAVPVVCGNVSRVTWAPLPGREPTLTAPVVHHVPEPGTLALVLAALAAAWRRARPV